MLQDLLLQLGLRRMVHDNERWHPQIQRVIDSPRRAGMLALIGVIVVLTTFFFFERERDVITQIEQQIPRFYIYSGIMPHNGWMKVLQGS